MTHRKVLDSSDSTHYIRWGSEDGDDEHENEAGDHDGDGNDNNADKDGADDDRSSSYKRLEFQELLE